jgi:fimbrial isopeptide formation D2 family protein/LPXTG-motif cell wall-anchored protein
MNKKSAIQVVFGWFLALMIVLGVGSAMQTTKVSAEGNDTQKVTLHKYAFETAPSPDLILNDGSDQSSIATENGGKPLQGIEFTAYDVTQLYTDFRQAGKSVDETFAELGQKQVSDLGEKTTSFAATDNNGLTSANLPVTSTVKLNDGTKKEENAVYVIVENHDNGDVAAAANLVISLPFYEEDGTTPLSEVNLFPKNTLNLTDFNFVKEGVKEDESIAPLANAKFVLKDQDGNYLNKELANNVLPAFDVATATDANAAVFTSDADGKVSTKELFSQGLALLNGTYTFEEIGSDGKAIPADGTTVDDYHASSHAANAITFTVENGQITKTSSFDKNEEPSSEAKVYNYQVPSPQKEANDTDVDDNQAFSFTVKQLIPDDIDTYTEFALVDTPDAQLEMLSDDELSTIAASIVSEKGEEIATLDTKATAENPGFGFDFTSNVSDMAAIKANAGNYITFTYKMKLKPGTKPEVDVNNEIDFDNNHHTNHDNETVDTYGKKFVKKDAYDDSKTLAGAEFLVLNEKKDEYRTINDTWAKYDGTSVPEDAKILTSDENGAFEVIGLATGNYNLKEVKAPADYQLPAQPYTEFKVTETSYSDAQQVLTVVNTQKGILPHTGGIGIFAYVLGGLAIIGIAVFYFKKRDHLNA